MLIANIVDTTLSVRMISNFNASRIHDRRNEQTNNDD